MLHFTMKEVISLRVKAKCPRHPKYNPETDGRGAIRANCKTCLEVLEFYHKKVRMEIAIREFREASEKWLTPTQPGRRRRASRPSTEAHVPTAVPPATDEPKDPLYLQQSDLGL